MIRFHALGGLTVTDEQRGEVGIGGPRQRRLLAMLLIHRNSVVSVDRLADAVFAGDPTPAASTTLRSYVARTRRLVDGAESGTVVVTQAPGYVLRVPVEAFDVTCFERSVAEGGSRLGRDDAAAASSVLREALALWRGDAYAEFADEDWARPEAQRLEELRLVAQERLIEAELACGRAAAMIPEIESLTREHSLREAFRAQLMIALYRAGRHADALRVFRDYRTLLVDELGVEPSPTLAALEQRVLSHDPGLAALRTRGTPVAGVPPRRAAGHRPRRHRVRRAPPRRRARLRDPGRPGGDRRPPRVRAGVRGRHPAAGGAPAPGDRADPRLLARTGSRLPRDAPDARRVPGRPAGARAAHGRRPGRPGHADRRSAGGRGRQRDRARPAWSPAACSSTRPEIPTSPTSRSPPADPTLTAGDDVHDFAAMVGACLARDRGHVVEVLTRGLATVGRPVDGGAGPVARRRDHRRAAGQPRPPS